MGVSHYSYTCTPQTKTIGSKFKYRPPVKEAEFIRSDIIRTMHAMLNLPLAHRTYLQVHLNSYRNRIKVLLHRVNCEIRLAN